MDAIPEPETDRNTLPYFVMDVANGQKLRVCFEPLTTSDEVELRSQYWADAVFGEVWSQLLNAEQTFKLYLKNSDDLHIQGLIHVGSVELPAGYLANSLLETAPFNRYRADAGSRRYIGVGRVLVARLVAESLASGGQGRVLVRPRPRTEGFYRKIGFLPVPPTSRRYILNATSGKTLLATACLDR